MLALIEPKHLPRNAIEEFARVNANTAVVRCVDICPRHAALRDQLLLLDAIADSASFAAAKFKLVLLSPDLVPHAAEVAFWMNRNPRYPARLIAASSSLDNFANWNREAARVLNRNESNDVITPVEPPPPRIETARLVLTVGTPDQIRGYYDAIVGTNMFDNLIWEGPSCIDDLLAWRWRSLRNFAKGEAFDANFGIIEKASGRQIGGCSWRPRPADPACGDIGYTLAPEFHRRGFGLEAIHALVHWAFQERQAARVEATVFEGNMASRGLLEKIGFAYEGMMRERIPKRGRRVSEWMFGLTRGAWEAAGK